jgi:hypothetical protein
VTVRGVQGGRGENWFGKYLSVAESGRFPRAPKTLSLSVRLSTRICKLGTYKPRWTSSLCAYPIPALRTALSVVHSGAAARNASWIRAARFQLFCRVGIDSWRKSAP